MTRNLYLRVLGLPNLSATLEGMTDSDIARLGQLALQRRLELGLSQAKVAEAGGPSDTTQTGLEAGTVTQVRPATLRKLDTGLQWEPGSAATVLRGGEPTPLRSDTTKSATDPRAARRAQDQDWVDPLGRIHLPLGNDRLSTGRIQDVLIAIADLDVQTRNVSDSDDPRMARVASSAQHVVNVVGHAVAEWMGGEDQLVELAEALSRLARQSRLTASSSADAADSTIIERLTGSGR